MLHVVLTQGPGPPSPSQRQGRAAPGSSTGSGCPGVIPQPAPSTQPTTDQNASQDPSPWQGSFSHVLGDCCLYSVAPARREPKKPGPGLLGLANSLMSRVCATDAAGLLDAYCFQPVRDHRQYDE